MQLLPYAILDMDGTLLDSSGMWDDVARGLLAQWDAVYTQGQGDDTMTMTIDGAAAYFAEQCHLPVTPQELARQIQEVVDNYESSTSWRVTKPLRALARWFRR